MWKTMTDLKTLKRINRYIVGCKLVNLTLSEMLTIRINRYIVGCKCNTERCDSIRSRHELIDT